MKNDVRRETSHKSNKDESHFALLSDEYIRGLVEGEGCFTFCTIPDYKNPPQKLKIPTFVIQMHERDKGLIEAMRNRLCLKQNRIYVYKMGWLLTHNYDMSKTREYKRGNSARVVIRDLGSLKNRVIPMFYKRLHGYKGAQFAEWLEKIGANDTVPERYKLLHRLYKSGFWDRNPDVL